MKDYIQVFEALPKTKEEQNTFIDEYRQAIIDGDLVNEPLLKWFVYLRSLKNMIAMAEKDETIKAAFIAAADMFTEKHIDIFNAEIQIKTKRNFVYGNDAVWNQLKAVESNASEKRKAREKFLQKVEVETLDPETGEMIQPLNVDLLRYPEVKFK